MNEMKIHSLDTVPYRSVTPIAFKLNHASFIFIYNILNVLHIFLFKKITSLSKIHGNNIFKCLWTDTNNSWQYFSQQKRIFLFTWCYPSEVIELTQIFVLYLFLLFVLFLENWEHRFQTEVTHGYIARRKSQLKVISQQQDHAG